MDVLETPPLEMLVTMELALTGVLVVVVVGLLVELSVALEC